MYTRIGTTSLAMNLQRSILVGGTLVTNDYLFIIYYAVCWIRYCITSQTFRRCAVVLDHMVRKFDWQPHRLFVGQYASCWDRTLSWSHTQLYL